MPQIAFFPFSFPGLPQVGVAFTSRRGGLGKGPYATANLSFDVGDDPETVRANRMAVQERLGFSHWLECHQVHGTVLHVNPEPCGAENRAELEGDGLATDRTGHALVIKTADCQPLLLADCSGKYIAALHVGWRGNVMEFPCSGVEAFCQAYGLDPVDVLAVRGPSLGPECSQFTNFDAEFGAGFQEYHNPDKQTVDLWRLTRDQLLAAGLMADNIHSLDLCTRDRDDTFFSYRREKTSGRQAGIIWIRP